MCDYKYSDIGSNLLNTVILGRNLLNTDAKHRLYMNRKRETLANSSDYEFDVV